MTIHPAKLEKKTSSEKKIEDFDFRLNFDAGGGKISISFHTIKNGGGSVQNLMSQEVKCANI